MPNSRSSSNKRHTIIASIIMTNNFMVRGTCSCFFCSSVNRCKIRSSLSHVNLHKLDTKCYFGFISMHHLPVCTFVCVRCQATKHNKEWNACATFKIYLVYIFPIWCNFFLDLSFFLSFSGRSSERCVFCSSKFELFQAQFANEMHFAEFCSVEKGNAQF